MGASSSVVVALLFLGFLIVAAAVYSSINYSKNLVKNAQQIQDTMKKAKMQTDITITNVSFSNYSGNLYLNITLNNTGKTTLNASLLDIFIDGVYSPSYRLSAGNTLVPENSTTILFSPSASITIDNAGTSNSSNSTKVLNLTNFTVGSGANRLLVVGLNYNNTPGTTNVSYNNVPLTRKMVANNSNKNYTELWYLASPPSGSYNISHNQTNATQVVMGAWSYTGVDQTTPIGNFTNATGTSNNSNVSITTTLAYSVLVDVETDGSQSSLTAGAGQTQRYKANTTKINGGGGEMGTSAAGTYNMYWTLGSSAAWVNIGAEIRPYFSNTINSTISRIRVVTENGISDYALES